jgi:hypothetical protein
LVTTSVRRVKIAIASACPMKGVFATAHRLSKTGAKTAPQRAPRQITTVSHAKPFADRKRCSDHIFHAMAREGMMRGHEHPLI